MFLVVVGVLGLLACNAIESSRQWQRFKNEHDCVIVPRSGDEPRRYVCQSEQRCTTDTDCMMKFGGDGGPEPAPKQWRM